jgi:hypothetical protein
MKYITVKWLREQGACEDGIEEFQHYFGSRCKISYDNLCHAYEVSMNTTWLGEILLPDVYRKIEKKAQIVFNEIGIGGPYGSYIYWSLEFIMILDALGIDI